MRSCGPGKAVGRADGKGKAVVQGTPEWAMQWRHSVSSQHAAASSVSSQHAAGASVSSQHAAAALRLRPLGNAPQTSYG
eukprot:60907-Chlamydomonas_euryale.AAC.1